LPARTSSSSDGVAVADARWRDSLGPWICAPLLAFAVLVVAIFAIPSADCEGTGDHRLDPAVLLGIGGAAALGCLAAAGYRVEMLRRGQGIPRAQVLGALAAVVVLVLLGVTGPERHEIEQFYRVYLAAAVATAIALILLLVAWIGGRRPDAVGLLLPAYLVGAALFVLPGVALLAAALKSGAIC
jgi:hypothetical protein